MKKEESIGILLNHFPRPVKLWSPMIGTCTFVDLRKDEESGFCHIILEDVNKNKYSLEENGKFTYFGECMLYPSEVNQNWERWYETLFEPDDKILYNDNVYTFVRYAIKEGVFLLGSDDFEHFVNFESFEKFPPEIISNSEFTERSKKIQFLSDYSIDIIITNTKTGTQKISHVLDIEEQDAIIKKYCNESIPSPDNVIYEHFPEDNLPF